jgi:hypothetical protein
MTTSALRTRLCCEQLESRANPSNVSISVSHNILYVTADGGDDIFTLQQTVTGAYAVTAGAGTLVNGRTAYNVGVIHPARIMIRAGNGNDHIAVLNANPSVAFSLILGGGSDFVNLSGVYAPIVNVNLGGGANTLYTTQVVAASGANIVSEGSPSVWYDTSFRSNHYLNDTGWSQIVPGGIL